LRPSLRIVISRIGVAGPALAFLVKQSSVSATVYGMIEENVEPLFGGSVA